MAAILVMWWILISVYLRAYIQNLAENGQVVTEKSKFNVHM